MTDEAALSTGPAAARVGVTENTLRAWARAGKVPHLVSPSGRYKFRIADLDKTFREVGTPPTAGAA